MNNTKLSFEVDASQIDIKPLLKKDFLELSMKAISSANPNRNNSWFTPEAMQRAVANKTFVNKPILGYFENGDFVSHNGEWEYDTETGMSYWDTLGTKGERILGLIRESDPVTIIQDDKGLSWIKLNCCLWTQYSFKQVKRLIKDAKRAQKMGGSAKNISVEVDITDYEILENGVMKINDFNLVGITILGSRNGMKVEPGIEDAELSVVDIMGKDLYAKQTQALRLAYEKLDNSDKKIEEAQKMDEVIKTGNFESTDLQTEEQPIVEEKFAADDVCPDCGKNPCVCEAKKEDEEKVEECGHLEEKVDECGHCEETPVEDKKEDECGHCAEESEPAEDEKQNESVDNKAECEVEEPETEHCEESEDDKDDEDDKDEGSEDKDEEPAKECGNNFEELSAQYEAVVSELEGLKARCEELASKVKDYEKKEFISKVNSLIKSSKIEDSVAQEFAAKCENDEITSIDDLKTQIALYKFECELNSKETFEEKEEKKEDSVAESFSAPIANPDVNAAFAEKKEEKVKNDRWSTLRQYVGK